MRFVRSAFLLFILTAFATSASGVYAHFDQVRQSHNKAEYYTPSKNELKQRLTPEQRVEKKLEWMRKELTLTDRQSATIRTILLEKYTKKVKRHSLKDASPEAKKAAVDQMLEQRRITHERIAAVLSTSQRTKYESLLKTEGGDVRKLHNVPRR